MDEDFRPSNTGERLARLETVVQNLVDLVRSQGRTINEINKQLTTAAQDIHAAKIGGRWVLATAMTFGAVIGWVANKILP